MLSIYSSGAMLMSKLPRLRIFSLNFIAIIIIYLLLELYTSKVWISFRSGLFRILCYRLCSFYNIIYSFDLLFRNILGICNWTLALLAIFGIFVLILLIFWTSWKLQIKFKSPIPPKSGITSLFLLRTRIRYCVLWFQMPEHQCLLFLKLVFLCRHK